MWLIKKNNYATAAKLLESHLNDSDLKQSAKIGIMAWIGECYMKARDHKQAGKWFESAGRAALDCKELMPWEKRKRAIEEFDQAITHYQAIDDLEGMGRVAVAKYSLSMGE